MSRSTTQLRAVWAPPCTGPFARVELHGEGVVSVRPAIVDAVLALNNVLKNWDYKTRRADTGAYNCRRITGGSGYSLHAYAIAIDINWQTNPYTNGPLITDMPQGMVDDIKAIRTNGGHQVWRWGGDYRSVKDAMHFEVVASPAELLTGIANDEEFDMEVKQQVAKIAAQTDEVHRTLVGHIEDSEFQVPGPEVHNLAFAVLSTNAVVGELVEKLESLADSLSSVSAKLDSITSPQETDFGPLVAAIESLVDRQDALDSRIAAAAAVLSGA